MKTYPFNIYSLLFSDESPAPKSKDEKPVNCPGCGVQMIGKDYEGIRIDECPNCESVFLDKGELDRICDKVADDVREDNEFRDNGFSSGFALGMLL